jgi:Flagellar hook-length control protein
MITDILGGKAPGVDAATTAKQAGSSQKGAGAQSKGFSDALSGFDGESGKGNAGGAAEDLEMDVAAEDAVEVQVEAKPVKARPIIDIRPEFAKRASGEIASARGEAPKDVKLTPAERKLRDALLSAKDAVKKSEELERVKSAKSDLQADAAMSSEPDTTILKADDAKVADMLSLLGEGAGPAAEISSLIQRPAAHASSKRARDTEGKAQSAEMVSQAGSKNAVAGTRTSPDPLAMPAGTEAPDAAGRTFRLTNARNDQRVDMSIGGNAAERSVEFKASSNTGAETVTVIDSRRFLGLAPNSNSANLTALISGDSEWSAAMQPSSSLSNAAAQSGTGTVVNMLKLQMNPHDLGQVTATLRLHGEELNVHLVVETRAAYRQLSEDSGGIVDALRAQGFAVDQVTISISPTADADKSGGRQDQAGQQSQQSAADGGKQGFSAGRGQEQPEARQRTVQGARGIDAVSDDSQTAGSGNGRPNQLYL